MDLSVRFLFLGSGGQGIPTKESTRKGKEGGKTRRFPEEKAQFASGALGLFA
jgi:hypothetical protein